MPISGNLCDKSFENILYLIRLAQKSGEIFIRSNENCARVIVLQGIVTFAQIGRSKRSLIDILYVANKINDAQFNFLQKKVASNSEKGLALLLINSGYSSKKEIINCLINYCCNILVQLSTWDKGEYYFKEDVPLPEHLIAVSISTKTIISEISPQKRERRHLKHEVAYLDMSLAFTNYPGCSLKKANLKVEEWWVVSKINPKTSIRKIASMLIMQDIEICRIVDNLLQKRLVSFLSINEPSAKTINLFH